MYFNLVWIAFFNRFLFLMTTSRDFLTNLASTAAAGFNGSANNTHGVTGTLPVANGGTGLASWSIGGIVYASGTTTLTQTTGASYDSTNFVGTLLSVNNSGIPTWTNTVDGGSY